MCRFLDAGIRRYRPNPMGGQVPLFAFHHGKWCAKLHHKGFHLAAAYMVCLHFRCRSPIFLLVFTIELLLVINSLIFHILLFTTLCSCVYHYHHRFFSNLILFAISASFHNCEDFLFSWCLSCFHFY